MKKIISILLIVLICIAPVSVSANTSETDVTHTIMGDANNDKKVTAADARLVLRVSSKLEPTDKVSLYNADTNADGKINASDARSVLRVAAKLSEFVNGFDGKGTPCVINVLKNNKYSLDLTYKDKAATDVITISLARDGDNIYMTSSDMGFDMDSMGFSSCGIMINDSKIYAILGSDKSNIAMYIPDSMCDEFGMSKNDLLEITDMIDSLIPENLGSAEQITFNNETAYRYTYEVENQECFLIVSDAGKILSIDRSDDSSLFVNLENISYDEVGEFFELNNYDLL